MKSAPPRVDQRIGWPLALPVPPAANSTRSGWPSTLAADQVPTSAGLLAAKALAAKKSASAKVKRVLMCPPLMFLALDGNGPQSAGGRVGSVYRAAPSGTRAPSH